MKDNENFALVRKPTGAVEKAAHGAKHILSCMVADTLAQSQKVDADTLYQKFRTCYALKKHDYARSLLRKAAEMGHTEAMYDCGMDYMSGDGFPQDNKQAIYWIRKAAEQGHAYAQFCLGVFYKKFSSSLPFLLQDLPEAYKWFKLAAEQGYNNGARSLASLSSTMTSDQLQEGESRYREFQVRKS